MKKKKWVYKRHKRIFNFFKRFFLNSYKKKYNFTFDKVNNQEEPHLIICNHQTGIDQFLIAETVTGPTYFVCTDDIMSIPFLSKLLKWGLNPIPYKKASTDLTFLRTCRQVVKEGGSIMIFPEGNRTYRGKTEFINPTISKMIKFLNIPLDILNLEGGFGAFPRFADKKRKGKIHISLKRTLSKEEIKNYSDEELNNIINQELMVEDYHTNHKYSSKNKAEYIERVLYRCPTCGLSKFISKGIFFWCETCKEKHEYLDDLTITNSKFLYLSEWYDYQTKTLLCENILNNKACLFKDKVKLYQVVNRNKKKLINKKVNIEYYSDHLIFFYKKNKLTINIEDILSTGVFGKNKVNLFLDNITYQLKGDAHFNGLKYVHYIYKFKIEKGKITNDFLGI